MLRSACSGLSVSLRVCSFRYFSKKSQSESNHQDLLNNLGSVYSETFDSKESYSNFKLETLLDVTETSNEVQILTTPNEPKFARTQVFDKIQSALAGKKLVFNLDPSIGLSIDRKFVHLNHIMDLKNMNAEFEEDAGMQDIKVMDPTITNQGFYRNVFNLKFSGESQFEVSTFQRLFQEHVRQFVNIEFDNETERAVAILNKARQFIWNEIVPSRHFLFVNMNIKMLFEHAIINSPPEARIFLGGMPELSYRAKFAHRLTPGSVLMDFQQITKLTEEYNFFMEVQKKADTLGHQLIDNLISKQDVLINSGFYFNSLQFRTSFTLELLKQLSEEHEDLVLISDPITTYHIKRVIKEKSFMEDLPDFKLEDL